LSHPPKIDRKTLRQPDEFQKKGIEFISRLNLERVPVIPFFLLLGGSLLGYFGYKYWTESTEEKSWLAYHKAVKEPEEKRWDALAKFQSDYASQRSGYFAGVTLADHYFDAAKKANLAAKPDEMKTNAELALGWYEKSLKGKSLSDSEKQLLRVQRGSTFELMGRLDEAQKEYTLASELNSPVGKGYALLSLARIWEMKKDDAKAAEFYGRVATEFSGSQYALLAKGHLRRLKSPIFNEGKKS